ncbi:DegT/DnrJ/EryC1/StrS family aminotransferase [Kordiimonas lacus]|uniref:dTDP-4-amino-4,6-dideoxygalactose transaminase n=1 Tax=Kordiimonas lacus TaxID=637679 RepID=A0A1G7F7P0_9PROT|nr:aminotransferase class I/II-fold pyridoxal phosphate-dependent enzyme [Kordiimonas lacus]SDE71864.1 dTDP-4-amino-4,6-dideoxygalactose transaminase [Kordiimonas lacus]
MSTPYRIHCLVPDLPTPEAVLPFLEEMHENRWYSNFGPLVKRFEAELTAFLGRENGAEGCHVATFSSATTAMELALKAMKLPAGANVLVPAVTFPATALVAMNAGLTPVLADVDLESWELTPDIARAALAQGEYAAVIPVAAFGRPVDPAPWVAFQKETGVPVILDVAAALGQQDIHKDLTYCFSLHATKPFGVGEGGLLVSSDEAMITLSRSLSNFGFQGPAGVVLEAGTNAKFPEYFASVGLVQIARWYEVSERRQAVLDKYLTGLKKAGNSIVLQQGTGDFIPAVFPIYMPGKAEKLVARMDAAGIQTRRWYLPPLYDHPALGHLPYADKTSDMPFAGCEKLRTGLVGLPFHAFLSDEDIKEICDIVAGVYV